MKRFSPSVISEKPFVVVQIEGTGSGVRWSSRLSDHRSELEARMDLEELTAVLKGVAVPQGHLAQIELSNAGCSLVGMKGRRYNDACPPVCLSRAVRFFPGRRGKHPACRSFSLHRSQLLERRRAYRECSRSNESPTHIAHTGPLDRDSIAVAFWMPARSRLVGASRIAKFECRKELLIRGLASCPTAGCPAPRESPDVRGHAERIEDLGEGEVIGQGWNA